MQYKKACFIIAQISTISGGGFYRVEGSEIAEGLRDSTVSKPNLLESSSKDLEEIKEQLKNNFEELLLRELLQKYHDEIDELKKADSEQPDYFDLVQNDILAAREEFNNRQLKAKSIKVTKSPKLPKETKSSKKSKSGKVTVAQWIPIEDEVEPSSISADGRETDLLDESSRGNNNTNAIVDEAVTKSPSPASSTRPPSPTTRKLNYATTPLRKSEESHWPGAKHGTRIKLRKRARDFRQFVRKAL